MPLADFELFKRHAEERVPDELVAWVRAQPDASSALEQCPYADWLLRLAECLGVSRQWQLKATATCVRKLLGPDSALTAAIDAVERGASEDELMLWLASLDRTARQANDARMFSAARLVADFVHAALVPDDEGLTAAIAGTVAELMARDRLLESGVEAFEASFDTHRRTLRLGLSVPSEHEPESCT
ncbi:MAG: hypothetical protein GQE15_06685 [Archangiaceae bacterium]|nr:hypothetical protein [Archangiaceae bacterium]